MNRQELLAACRARGTSALAAACVGAFVSGFYAVAEWPDGNPAATITIGAIIGVFVYAFIAVLERLTGPAIDRRGPTIRAFGHSLLFVIGGMTGGLCGLAAGTRLFGHPLRVEEILLSERIRFFAIMAGFTALATAFGFRAYDLMRARLARTAEQLKEAEWAEKELELAREIQTRLLPPPRVEQDGFVIEARNLPARFVAGDFYDIVPLDDGSIVIVVADVAGKGMGASLIMASVKAVLPFVAREGAQRAMSMLNAKLVQELGRREFVALVYAHFTPSDGSLEVLNAGLPEPYIVSASGVRALVNSGERLPLGLRAGIAYEPLAATLARGERLVFLSDGIPEAPVNGEPFGYERLADVLMRAENVDALLDAVRNAGGALEDDWTAVMVERR
jgi:serine phosphatase RsbU (regulator of sigma subunit)